MSKSSSTQSKLTVLRAANLRNVPWLRHGFSTRKGGVSRGYGGGALNLGFTKEDSKTAVERNRSLFLKQLCAKAAGKTANGSQVFPLVTLRQIHSDVIHFVGAEPEDELFGDGMVTATPGLMLGIQTADCLPIVLVDSRRAAVGVFHAGWRGTYKRIVEKGVGRMRLHFGSRPRDIRAAIGPGIHRCCYEVGEDVKTQFEAQFPYGPKLFHETEEVNPVREKYPMLFLTARAPGHSILPKKIFLDLVEANREQLLAAGVVAKNIEASPLCTNCNPDLLFSYRAERGKTGRMMGVVGIRE